jgi:Holliday junction resolvase-like predicted endonuclease
MDSSSPGMPGLRRKAEWEATAPHGMRILDRSWRPDDGDPSQVLDLVAAAHGGVLVVVDVRGPDDPERDVDHVSETRLASLRATANAWLEEHQAVFRHIRVDAAGDTPRGFRYVPEVGRS